MYWGNFGWILHTHMNFSSKSPVLVFSTQYIGWPIATRRQSQKDGDGNNLETTERGEKGGRVDNLRMLSMAPCVKNLKIPKNTICKLENKQRNERQKRKEWIIGVICRPIIFCVFVFLKRKRGVVGDRSWSVFVYMYLWEKKGKERRGLLGICLDMPPNLPEPLARCYCS